MRKIKKNQVVSSTVKALGYDKASKTLRIWFVSGAVYDYRNVPGAKYEALKKASSIGAYFNKNIRDTYVYKKIAE